MLMPLLLLLLLLLLMTMRRKQMMMRRKQMLRHLARLSQPFPPTMKTRLRITLQLLFVW